jgi:hypothetical protein
MILGLDLLAGAQYTKQVVYAAKKGYAIGLFAITFGDAYKTAEAALKNGCKLLRMQLLWEDNHTFGDKHIKQIKKLAKKYNQLANKYPHADIRLSPFCEHNVSNPDKYLDIAQQHAPNCLIVNTPYKGALSKKYINEKHGDSHSPLSGRHHYSDDGLEITNADAKGLQEKHKNAEVFFHWTSRFNLRWNEKDKANRPTRIKEAKQRKPTNDMIDSIAYLFSEKGVYNLDKNTLLKSHSERHSASDKRGDKLLFITPHKVNALILKRNGKQIGKLPYYGGFEDGRHRYYANQFAFKYGANVEVWAGNKKIGTVNCGFRSPPYR